MLSALILLVARAAAAPVVPRDAIPCDDEQTDPEGECRQFGEDHELLDDEPREPRSPEVTAQDEPAARTAIDPDDASWLVQAEPSASVETDALATHELGFASAAAVAEAAELYAAELPQQRPSRWGRVDLSLAWRRTIVEQPADRREEVWLIATWRY